MKSKNHRTDEVLLINAQEACRRLGGISRRTLARLESRGLLVPVPLWRHKMFRRSDLEKLITDLSAWNA